jgi:hypothetical protein
MMANQAAAPPASSRKTGKVSRRGRVSEGRPSKMTAEVTKSIADSISLGLNDEEAAVIADINPETLSLWRKIPEFSEAIQKAVALRLRTRLLLIQNRVDNWPAIGWLLERQYPLRFSKPEKFDAILITLAFL